MTPEEEAAQIRRFICSIKGPSVSWAVLGKFLNFARRKGKLIQELSEAGQLFGIQSMRRKEEEELPTVYIDTHYFTQVRDYQRNIREYRLKRLKLSQERKNDVKGRYICKKYYLDLVDIVKHVQTRDAHLDQTQIHAVQFSVDGVEESKTSEYTLLIVSIAFNDCGKPYPWKVYEHLPKKRPPVKEVYGEIVQELREERLLLHTVPADGKERKIAKCFSSTNSYYCCDFCEAQGNPIPDPKDPTDDRPKKHGIFYPAKYQECRERTVQRVREQAEAARDLPPSKVHYMGVKDLSPLLEAEGFDFIWGLPFDCFHQLDYGLIKRIIYQLFYSSKQADMLDYNRHLNEILVRCKIPTEHERRTKELKMDRAKSREYKLMGLFLFIPIAREVFDMKRTGAKDFQVS